jgi:hypothetical protein
MIFLKQYLQAVWPNVWKVEPLWHPIATSADYPDDRTPLGTSVAVGTNGVTLEYDMDANPEGLPTVYRTNWQGKQRLYSTARTNLLTYSQAFDNAAWSKTRATVATSSAVAPDGTATAYKLTEDTTASNTHNIIRNVTVAANTTVTYSVFVKAAERTWACVQIGNFSNQTNAQAVYINLATGELTASDMSRAKVTAYPNGWYRVSTTVTTIGSSVTLAPSVYTALLGTSATYTGDGTSGIHVWGAQLEVGGTVTSYVPTTTTTVTVTDYTVAANGVATFSDGVTPATALTHFRTGRIRVTLPVTSDNGLGLLEIAKAFRSTLAPRLLLELQLSTIFENKGNTGGLAFANVARGVMPILAIGKLS